MTDDDRAATGPGREPAAGARRVDLEDDARKPGGQAPAADGPAGAGPAADEPSTVKSWLAVIAVAVGIFSLMTSELLPVGLLTPVGDDLGVSEGTAGLMVTVPGLVAAIAAPLVTVAAGRIDRRVVLALLIGMMGAANLACAVAQDFVVVLAARLLVGISVGGFWAIAGGLALRLVPERHVPRAMAVIFGGVSTASVLGVPAGTAIGDWDGWRTAFAAVGILGLAALACIVFLVPALPPGRTLNLRDLPAVFRGNEGVRLGIVITFLVITGHFLAYTFIRPILEDVSGFGSNAIGTLLLVYGTAGVVGNVLASTRAARHLRGTVLTIALTLTAAMALVPLLGENRIGGGALLVVWGLAYGGVSVTLQTWMLQAAPDATEAATGLFVATFNLSIALGALLGGVAVNALATSSVLWIGAVMLLLTTVAVRASGRVRLA
ncbi:MFS transporter [Streptomyces sp. 184]|uniref:MFS transporter n=1 Tax=Streptomyces sp. 184 TaxID=1827526 RepID=UPI0038917237